MSEKVKGPYLPNLEPLIQAGIDPKTGLPRKVVCDDPVYLKENVKRLLKVTDRQDAINRYVWHNLPNLTSQMLENMLYYKRQLAFFCIRQGDEAKDVHFFALPYSLAGTIDVYGRYMRITPLPFGNGSVNNGDEDKEQKPWIEGLTRDVVYDIVLPEEMTLDMYDNSCVIIQDYSNGIAQTDTPRSQLQDAIIDIESNCLPYMNTAMMNSTGVKGMRVDGEEAAAEVELASRAIQNAALTGKKFIPMVGMTDFQDFTDGAVMKSAEFMQAMESLDNYRLGTMGIKNGGLFQKKTHMLQTEQDMAGSGTSSALQDGLTLRQHACDVINSIWGLGIWCEIGEANAGVDKDMDGELTDETNNIDINEPTTATEPQM